jgi:hypothetical protein
MYGKKRCKIGCPTNYRPTSSTPGGFQNAEAARDRFLFIVDRSASRRQVNHISFLDEIYHLYHQDGDYMPFSKSMPLAAASR